MRSVENAECGKCVENFSFPFNKNLTSEQHSANCSCKTSLILLRVSCD